MSEFKLPLHKSKNVNVNVKQSGENKKAKIEKAKLYAKNKNSFSN